MDQGMIMDLIIQGLIFPGLFFIVFLIIFTQWIYRKITARIQYRRGPCYTGPLGFLQPFADFMKLLVKEDVVTRYSVKHIPIVLASIGLGSLIAILLLTPLSLRPFYGDYDIIILFYLGLWGSFAILFIGLAAPNPYTSLGVGRYMALLVSSEPSFIASFIVPVIIASRFFNVNYSFYKASILSHRLWTIDPFSTLSMILAAIAGFMALMGILEIRPFDFPEAEGEIYWGIFTEYGGPSLALGFFILFTERIVFPLIYVMLFLGGSWPVDITMNYWAGFLIIFTKFILLFILLTVIDNVMPRLRPDQGVRILWKYALTLSVIALIISLI